MICDILWPQTNSKVTFRTISKPKKLQPTSGHGLILLEGVNRMADADNLMHSLLSRLFRTEVSILRSYRSFLMHLPLHGSACYQTGTPVLQKRLFGPNFGFASDSAFELIRRPGSILTPRSNGREIKWDTFFKAITEDDSNVISSIDPEEINSSIFSAGESVTYLNGSKGDYNPVRLQELREKCVDVQNDYLMQIIFCTVISPELVSILFGLKPDTCEAIKDLGMSSLKNINDLYLFPRVITLGQGPREDGVVINTKIFAWAYEIAADVKLGIVSEDLIELLRYDTLFTSHRHDVFDSLSHKINL